MDEFDKPIAPVIDEIDVSSKKLHQLANGEPVILHGELFAIRALLKSSFKVPKSNYVVKSYVLQILATGKDSHFMVDHAAPLVKVEKATKKVREVGTITLTEEVGERDLL